MTSGKNWLWLIIPQQENLTLFAVWFSPLNSYVQRIENDSGMGSSEN